MTRKDAVVDRLYRALLRLLPAEFRGDFGADMAADFRDARRDLRGWAFVRLLARELPGVVAQAARQHAADVRQDASHALRLMRRSPRSTAVIVLTLAIGTGANAAMFSVVDAVLLRSPYPDISRVVGLQQALDGQRRGMLNTDPDHVRQLSGMTEVFDAVGAFGLAQPTLTDLGEPRRVKIECVSAGMFGVMRMQPALGRAFDSGDDAPGAPPVVVVTHAFWQRDLGGRADVLGLLLHLDGHPVSVIGVMPAQFDGLRGGGRSDMLAPLFAGATRTAETGCHADSANVYARIRSDVTFSDADARLQALTNRTRSLISFDESTVGDDRQMLLLLSAAVGFVLLIACANVANLLLERTTSRGRELATRLALGASRGRLVRQTLTESILLSAIGAVAGLIVADASLSSLVAIMPAGVPHLTHVEINGRIEAAAILVGVLVGLSIGVVPAMRVVRRRTILSAGDARGTTERSWARAALVVTEVALSVTLLVGATLVVQSFVKRRPSQPGFDASGKVTASVMLARQRYATPALRLAFLHDALDRLRGLPGVTAVAAANELPFTGMVSVLPTNISGRPAGASGRVMIDMTSITPNYFDVMRVPLRNGRAFGPADTESAPLVAIVNETMARRYWPSASPLGQTVSVQSPLLDAGDRLVVGVVSDTRWQSSSTKAVPQVFFPIDQASTPRVTFVLSAPGAAADGLARPIRQAVAAIDRTQVVDAVTSFGDILTESMTPFRFTTSVMAGLAVMAIGLAAVGLGAVIASSVTRRTREIGVRMALGADRRRISRLVMGETLRLTLAGTAGGVGLALATTRYLADELYAVTPLDRTAFAGAVVLMFAVAAVASYAPARRAAEIDPIVTLRAE